MKPNFKFLNDDDHTKGSITLFQDNGGIIAMNPGAHIRINSESFNGFITTDTTITSPNTWMISRNDGEDRSDYHTEEIKKIVEETIIAKMDEIYGKLLIK